MKSWPGPSGPAVALSSTVRHFLVSQSQSPEPRASHLLPLPRSFAPEHTEDVVSPGLTRRRLTAPTVHVQTVGARDYIWHKFNRPSSNNAGHCKTWWIGAGNGPIIHSTRNITGTTRRQQHTTDNEYFTTCLPYLLLTPLHVIVKGKDIIWEQRQSHRSQYGARQATRAEDRERSLKAAFLMSVNALSSTNRSQLFRLPCRPLVWFPVGFIEPGVHAVHALCPLPVDHSSFLLTVSQTQKQAVDHSRSLLTASARTCTYLLSWMWPSTLWSSFPNMPHGLKVNTHLSPVLMDFRDKKVNP